jgi:hypothetical protein
MFEVYYAFGFEITFPIREYPDFRSLNQDVHRNFMRSAILQKYRGIYF